MPLVCSPRGVLPVCLAALGIVPGTLAGQHLRPEERQALLTQLHASRAQFHKAVGDLTDAQWTFKPAPDVWSVAEVAEHITVSEDALRQLVLEEVLTAPAEPGRRRELPAKADEVVQFMHDRSQRFQAPAFVAPAGRWPSRGGLLEAFDGSRAMTIAFVDTTRSELHAHFRDNPALGPLDGYEWLWWLAAHTERHLMQIAEVKTHPAFPRRRG